MAQRSPITTHVLDLAQGGPASGILVTLEKSEGKAWQVLASGVTNADGRIETLLEAGSKAKPGTYRLTFETRTPFYPFVTITFEIQDPGQHYHVPLLLSPYGYSTYRGS